MARPRKDPYIYQIDGNYWAFLGRNGTDDGRRSLHTKDKKEAQERFGALLLNAGLRENVKNERSLASIFDETYTRCRTNNAKKTAYEFGLNIKRVGYWLEAQGITKASEITKDIVEKYKQQRRLIDKVSEHRINPELVALRKSLAVAVELNEAKEQVLKQIVLLKEPKPDPKYKVPTREQIEEFLSVVDFRYYPLAKLTLGSGLRCEESRHLIKRCLSHKGNSYMITVTPLEPGECECCEMGFIPKNKKYRNIPVSKETYEAAETFIAIANELGFRKETKERRIWRAYDRASKKVGLEERLTLHPMRHTYASYLYDAGYSRATIKEYMGHEDTSTTEKYIHAINYKMPESHELPF